MNHYTINFSRAKVREARILASSENRMDICLEQTGGGFTLPDAVQNARRYLTGFITIKENHSLPLTLRFLDRVTGEERAHFRFTLLPDFRTKVFFDLNWLDMNIGGFPRTPGALKKVIYGVRTDLSQVGEIELGVKPVFHDVRVIFEDFEFSDEMPTEFPLQDKKMVDAFGQYMDKDWPGKIKSLEQMAQIMHTNEGPAEYPFPNWNKWGGDADRKLKEGTGFFSAIKTEDGRWHLTDPDGCDYFSMGTCCTRPRNMGDITSLKSLLSWFPEESDPLYRFYEERKHPWSGKQMETYDFLAANLYRVYGEDWEEKGEEIAYHVLMSHGVNSQGNAAGLNINDGNGKLPYPRQLPAFPQTRIHIFRDFPDVLSPEYRESAAECAQILNEWKDDPWMIGYFLKNEPQFGNIAGVAVANEVLHNPADTWCRRGLIEFLQKRYETVDALNCVWKTEWESFDALKAPIDDCIAEYPGSEPDLREFSVYLVKEYNRIPCEECRRVDPNHLILGMRWAKLNNPDILAGWEYMDVFSFNCYVLEPYSSFDYVTAAGVDRPILIGEYHAGALDRGLTATGIKGVASQEDRRILWREFVEGCAAHPYGVGAHWFEFIDEFVLGRFDGENYQIGMLDICMQPYPEIMQGVRETAEVLYSVRNGEKAPFDRMPEMIPMVG